MPNATPSPWKMFLPLGIIVLLAVLWSCYWLVASGIAKDRLAAERSDLASRGITLGCAQESWGGYPFHFEFHCSSPILADAGRVEIRSANLLLVALAYAPWQVAALIDGPTTVTASGLMPREVRHQRALAAVTIDKAWQPAWSVEMPLVEVENLARAQEIMFFTRPSATGGTDVALRVSHLVYAADGKPPVSVDEGSLQGTLTPSQSFKLDTFDLRQGQLRYWGSGAIAFDDRHRITGQIDTETNDVQSLLAVAGPQLGLSDGKLANLRTMLGLLGNEAKAPIIARDGLLYLGPFQIAELKPLY